MQNKHKQLAKEAERQILVQEEESDADSDYKATNSSKSEEEAKTEDGSKVICQIEGCEKMLKWCGFPSSMKTHLSGTHHITKEEKSKSHPYSKQELLTKNVIGFVIGTVQPLSIVEDKDFIKMVPCTKTLKERISLAYEAGTEKVKNQLLQLENISLTLDAWSSSAHIPYLDVTVH
ncbi:9156_t:CDS:2 [Rhizophagus irregularis]|nr:9156_t:CDS:2 [Rhizophagus irregularis]